MHPSTFTEAGSASLLQPPLPSPAYAKPSITTLAMHSIPLQPIDYLEASTHWINQHFLEMNQILQRHSEAMQQLFNQLHHFLQYSLIVPTPNPPVKCPNYPSSLNPSYLNPSGNYNTAANGVPWF